MYSSDKFTSLSASSACTDGDLACINGTFAQCSGKKFLLTACAVGTICVTLPLVNKPGTSMTCDTSADRDARIAATGAIHPGQAAPAPAPATAPPPADKQVLSDDKTSFTLSNGKATQALNKQFASLTTSSSCTGGQNASVNNQFAQCVDGKIRPHRMCWWLASTPPELRSPVLTMLKPLHILQQLVLQDYGTKRDVLLDDMTRSSPNDPKENSPLYRMETAGLYEPVILKDNRGIPFPSTYPIFIEVGYRRYNESANGSKQNPNEAVLNKFGSCSGYFRLGLAETKFQKYLLLVASIESSSPPPFLLTGILFSPSSFNTTIESSADI
ncbi:hypothetical protein BU17DRAFT_68617 [Hysterangium stoloniferum]|nr:hypothetical protein BU17DRAFT_68617 [Hysterangium stoloniferum]